MGGGAPGSIDKYTLVAEPGKTVTLTRGGSCTDALFAVSNADLTLGSAAAGLTGNIIIDGGGAGLSGISGALINLTNGTLTMNGDVTLTNNAQGGVSGSGAGTFTMTGGEISGNTANDPTTGGGIYVSGGTFIMSGGSIKGGGVYRNCE